MAYPAGTLRRINHDLASYDRVAATADGRTLVAVRDEVRVRLWIAPADDTARARPITDTSTGSEGATGVAWTGDGRIIYSAITQNSWDIWIAHGDGTEPSSSRTIRESKTSRRCCPGTRRSCYVARTGGRRRCGSAG